MNQLISDWLGVGHWIPDTPHKPIGLLGAILAWHGTDNLDQRPATLDVARESAELAAHRARIATQATDRREHTRQREAGRAALQGSGRAWAAREITRLAQHSARRRTAAAAAEAAALHAAIDKARRRR